MIAPTKALRLSGEQLHTLLDALPVATSWATLPEGRIQFVNRFFTQSFGYDKEAFATGDEWIDRTYVRSADRIEARRRWQALWTTRSDTTTTEIQTLDIEVLCADGNLKTVQHRGVILRELGVGLAVFDDISERCRAEDALRRIAFEDPLTGLPNRRALQDLYAGELDTALSDNSRTALIMLDLDKFKGINDELGHEAGDAALKTVAERLREGVGDAGLVYRLGGDEFVILLRRIRSLSEVEQVCSRIRLCVCRPWKVGERPVTLRASIGVSLFPQDGSSLRELLKAADQALYCCKKSNPGGFKWFRS